MTLVLKPVGPGNWAPLFVTIEGRRAAPLLFRRGDIFPLNGRRFRICEVRA